MEKLGYEGEGGTKRLRTMTGGWGWAGQLGAQRAEGKQCAVSLACPCRAVRRP